MLIGSDSRLGLGKLGRLKDLFLHDNRLEGPIPDELGDLGPT